MQMQKRRKYGRMNSFISKCAASAPRGAALYSGEGAPNIFYRAACLPSGGRGGFMNGSDSRRLPKNTAIEDKLLMSKADTLFRFVMLYHDFANEKKNYGTGEYVSMVEAHTLMEIADHPGITVSVLAERANRTKGAISQTIKKLDRMGYIARKKTDSDQRVVDLYPTERGMELHQAHREYDYAEMCATFSELLEHCSQEEVDGFFRVVNAYLTIFSAE
jgi:DNA-binding MarR family transcriptional regulator